MEPVIECKELVKVYTMGREKVSALRGIDLKIYEGEFVALLGKSGSGKSTLLNMLAGLEKPTSGQVILKGNHLENLNETKITNIRKKSVGFIFQSYNLLSHHTALENVSLPLVFNNLSKGKRKKVATDMLAAVGLGDRLFHRPSQMSGGQQQRVSIARAFVNSPEIVFADEPTGNLDTKTTEEVMSLMLELIKKNNQTFVMVTHDPETAEVADKIIYMRDGIIESVIDNKQHRLDLTAHPELAMSHSIVQEVQKQETDSSSGQGQVGQPQITVKQRIEQIEADIRTREEEKNQLEQASEQGIKRPLEQGLDQEKESLEMARNNSRTEEFEPESNDFEPESNAAAAAKEAQSSDKLKSSSGNRLQKTYYRVEK